MADNYNIVIDYKNCRTQEDKKECFERALRKFNRKVFKLDFLTTYIEKQSFVKPSFKKKLQFQNAKFKNSLDVNNSKENNNLY